jgi:hypothetical protein
MSDKNTLTQEQLKEQLTYDPDTGIFRWNTTRVGVKRGKIAGCYDRAYYVIRLNGFNYRAGRLAWLYMTGEWPKYNIDHRNNVTDDNRFINLRDATYGENNRNSSRQKNSSSGYKGVSKEGNAYRSRIMFRGKDYNTGCHPTAEDAYLAYCKKAKELHGEFANCG